MDDCVKGKSSWNILSRLLVGSRDGCYRESENKWSEWCDWCEPWMLMCDPAWHTNSWPQGGGILHYYQYGEGKNGCFEKGKLCVKGKFYCCWVWGNDTKDFDSGRQSFVIDVGLLLILPIHTDDEGWRIAFQRHRYIAINSPSRHRYSFPLCHHCYHSVVLISSVNLKMSL